MHLAGSLYSLRPIQPYNFQADLIWCDGTFNETSSWPPCVEGGADAIKKRTSSMKGNFIELVPRGTVMIGQTSQNKSNCRTDDLEIHYKMQSRC